MTRANNDIRAVARGAGVTLWMIAEEIGVSEATLTRRLRTELDSTGKAQLIEAIGHISRKEAAANENADDPGNG